MTPDDAISRAIKIVERRKEYILGGSFAGSFDRSQRLDELDIIETKLRALPALPPAPEASVDYEAARDEMQRQVQTFATASVLSVSGVSIVFNATKIVNAALGRGE
jgi:hypothetical protein